MAPVYDYSVFLAWFTGASAAIVEVHLEASHPTTSFIILYRKVRHLVKHQGSCMYVISVNHLRVYRKASYLPEGLT